MGAKKWKILITFFRVFMHFSVFFLYNLSKKCICYNKYLLQNLSSVPTKKLYVNRIYGFGYGDPNVGIVEEKIPPVRFLFIF